MQEVAAAHQAFARIVAVDHAVDGGEIGLPLALAGARRPELAGARLRVLDPLGRGGMRGQEIGRARIDIGRARLPHLRIAPERGEEARRPVGIEAGPRRDADPDAVGLEFLGAREARQRDLRFRQRQRADLRIAQHAVDHAAHQRDLAHPVLAHLGVMGDHMRHLVRHHRGELGAVVGERDQPAGHVELARGQREGVDHRRVEQGDAIVQIRPLGCRHQLLDRLADHGLDAGILIGAVIGGENPLMLALGRRIESAPPRRRVSAASGSVACRSIIPELAQPASSSAAASMAEQRVPAAPTPADAQRRV